jgi:sarcosine oxidase subunit gamma
MPSSLRRESPLTDFLAAATASQYPSQAGVKLQELPFRGYVNVRGNPHSSGLLDDANRCLGISLPIEPNTLTANEAITAAWLGPDEWLLITSPGKEGEVVGALRDALRNHFVAVTDVTDGQTILRVSGPRATDVLRKGCSLDLHPGNFSPGHCAQTHLDKIGVLIRKVDDSPQYDLIVRRSFTDYLTHWLQDAAAEYGFAVVKHETTE